MAAAAKLMRLALNRVQKLNTIQPPDRAADETAKFLSKFPTKCMEHEEPVKSFCADHDVLICDVCALSNHKACQMVMGFTEASKGIRSSREVTVLENGLKKMIEDYDKMFKEQSEILTNLAEQEREFVKAVKQFRGEINAILDRLENSVLAKKDNYTTQRRDTVKDHKQSCKTAMTLLENYSKELDRCYLANDNEALFVSMKKTRAVMDKYETQRKNIAKAPKKVSLSFVANNGIAKFFLSLRDFGDMKADTSVVTSVPSGNGATTERRTSKGSLSSAGAPPLSDRKFSLISLQQFDRRMSSSSNSLQTSERINLLSSDDVKSEAFKTNLSLPKIESSVQMLNNDNLPKTRRPTHVGDVSVFLESDTEMPFITGITFMADDHVVLADDANKNVKLFTHAFFPVAMVALTSPPRDVAPIKLQQVVVTIPTEKALQFIDLGKELLLRNKINLDFECFGVTCFNQELYVTSGFSSEREIRIMSLSGEVRKRIRPGIVDLRYPLYIAVDPKYKTIFVSDYNHGVVGVDTNSGELKFKCKDTDVHGYYKGITIGNKGNIYVCTWNLHGVSRVHLDGRGLETVIPMPGKEGRKPHSVAFSKKSERLVISLCGGKRACLSVYRYQ
ncbi:hypothetical protein DPMN_184201 [Dreissena polymorpha]|uniref:B box-type domain-containing protein n=1 Tax=Dreissena polymorpha TaxID=45954 RepID=A0A9D4I661_DREPO|nr:hypothetical protein DPMN_184201 [Dreissena polymorpha]